MSKQKKSDDSSVYYLFALLCLFLICKLIEKATPYVVQIYEDYWVFVMLFSMISVAVIVNKIWNKVSHKRTLKVSKDQVTNGKDSKNSVFAGIDDKGKEIFINLSSRRMHTQVIGTTNAGKTESVIIPWAVDDMSKERGFLILDGKAERGFLDKLYSYIHKHKRVKDFKYFSLTNIELSHTFNPLMGGTPEEITERIFNAFTFDNEYYRGVQYEIFGNILRLFEDSCEIPTFLKVYEAISVPNKLEKIVNNCKDENLVSWAMRFMNEKPEDREKKVSGILSQLSQFSFGKTACLFNTETPSIDLDSALKNSELIYFQLPVLRLPFLGKATGKLILQALQAAISERHNSESKELTFFPCYLDDFSEFIPPSFVSLLNKSRSANIGITFAHQALGDLKALGEDIENTILVNSNLKIFMRTNEPESAEYFSKVIGTKLGEKFTERQSKKFLHKENTGERSVRQVEEFIYHPQIFKEDLGVGDAIVRIPYNSGVVVTKLKFSTLPDLPLISVPKFEKSESKHLTIKEAS